MRRILAALLFSASPILAQTAAPVISPASGTYSAAQTITITDATPGATIYYTLDGSTPTTASPVYAAPFTIKASTAVNAIAQAPLVNDLKMTQASPDWDKPCVRPACAPGGAGVPFSATQTQNVNSPSQSGKSMQFELVANQSSTNMLNTFYADDCDSCTTWGFDIWLYVPATGTAPAQQEIDSEQFNKMLNREIMLGLQCNHSTGTWNKWNQAMHAWVNTTNSCTAMAPGSWHHVVREDHRSADGALQCYDSLSLDGTAMANWPACFPTSVLPAGWKSGIGYQVQINIGDVPAGQKLTATEFLDNASFTSGTLPSAATNAAYSILATAVISCVPGSSPQNLGGGFTANCPSL